MMNKNVYSFIKGGALIIFVFFSFFLFTPSNVYSQAFTVLEAKNNADMVKIIDTALLTGLSKQGLVSNIKFTGSPRSAGYFKNGGYIDMPRGIVLTSGLATNAKGPNKQPAATGMSSGGRDADLEKLGGSMSFDACIIEFDFIPMSNKVKFNFVFGSEEYNSYVNKGFNDVFGFFISGPGLSGPYSNNSKNIALVPGTSDPVSIDNVNCGQNDNYKIKPTGPGKNCKYYRFNDMFPGVSGSEKAIEYNGFTTVFVAQETVVPCKKYHMKLAIADIGDNALDSGVFLEAQSFDIGDGGYDVSYTHKTITGKIIDGCNEATVEISQSDLKEDRTIAITYSGDAVIGTDVESLPDYVVLTPAEPKKILHVKAKPGMPKTAKTLKISVENILCGSGTSFDYIFDLIPYSPLKITNPDEMDVMCASKVKLSAQYKGGFGPFVFDWDTGDKKKDIQVDVKHNPIHLKVTDQCSSDEKDIKFNVEDISAEFDLNKDQICSNEEVELKMKTSAATSSGTTVKWDLDGGVSKDLGNGSYTVKWDSPGKKSIKLDVSSTECGDASYQKDIEVLKVPEAKITGLPAEGCSPVEFDLIGGSDKDITYSWEIPGIGNYKGKDLSDKIDKVGTYDVKLLVSNKGKCTNEIIKEKAIKVYPSPVVDIVPPNPYLTGNKPDYTISLNKPQNDWVIDWIVDNQEKGIGESITLPGNEINDKEIDVKVKNGFGCKAVGAIKYTVVAEELFVPNAIAPYGVNRTFQVKTKDVREGEIFIYNKWGQQIFHSRDIEAVWDARFQGKVVQPDAYVVRVNYTTIDGRKKSYSGQIYVII
ncbi:MAG: choice-of-anchor L domain-containing protein [Bacteroidales bacterium]